MRSRSSASAPYDVRHEGAGLGDGGGWARATGTPGVLDDERARARRSSRRRWSSPPARVRRSSRSAATGQRAGTTRSTSTRSASRRRSRRGSCGSTRPGAPRLRRKAFCARAPRAAAGPAERAERRAAGGVRPRPLSRPQGGAARRAAPPPIADRIERRRPRRSPPGQNAPVLLVGAGAKNADAGEVVPRLAERVGAVVATTLLAKNWLNDAPTISGSPAVTGRGPLAAARRRRLPDRRRRERQPYTSDNGELSARPRSSRSTSPGRANGRRTRGDAASSATRGHARRVDHDTRSAGHHSTGCRTPDVGARLGDAFDDPAWVELEPGTVDPREACPCSTRMPAEHLARPGERPADPLPTMLLRRQRPVHPRPAPLRLHRPGPDDGDGRRDRDRQARVRRRGRRAG